MDKSPVIKAAEDLRDLVNTEVSDPHNLRMLLRYLEDFEDKYRGESERRLLPALRGDRDRELRQLAVAGDLLRTGVAQP